MPDDPSLTRRQLLRGRLFSAVAKRASDALDKAQHAFSNTVDAAARPATPSLRPDAPSPRGFSLPIHRPPGAIDESAFLASCTRCNDCAAACPVQAIIPAPERYRQAAGTPMIDAHTAACIMCPDTPCITACKPGVLRSDQPRKMGVAWIQTQACLAYTGSFCTVCAERCPVQGAITLSHAKPSINEHACTGCGVCFNVCPAPVNAVVLMPMADRPKPNPSSDVT